MCRKLQRAQEIVLGYVVTKICYEVSTDLATDKEAYQYYDWFDSYSSENEDSEDYIQTDVKFDLDGSFFTRLYVGVNKHH